MTDYAEQLAWAAAGAGAETSDASVGNKPQTIVKRWATVTQLSPLRIRLDGDTVALPFAPDSLVDLTAVNQRVWVEIVGKYVVITGAQRLQTEWISYHTGTIYLMATDADTWVDNVQMQASLPIGKYLFDLVLVTRSNLRQDLETRWRGVANLDGYHWAGARYSMGQNYGDGIINYAEGILPDNVVIPGNRGIFHSSGLWAGHPPLRMSGILNVSTAGTVGLQHRKAAATANQIIILRGSWLRFTKLA